MQERLLSMPELEPQDVTILYQHSVLCQTSMPYRDPGEEVRLWQRRNGIMRLELQAGRVLDPTTDDFVNVGLPFGPKPRLVLFHLNAEAMRKQSPVIELEDSLTAFVRRTLGLDTKGRNIRAVKDQLSRLAAADFRIGATHDGRAVTVKGTVIEGLELWSPKDASQRVLWPTVIQFSDKYFQSLMQHAVPLNEAAVARLSHSAMALDVYTWLANACTGCRQRSGLRAVDFPQGTVRPWLRSDGRFPPCLHPHTDPSKGGLQGRQILAGSQGSASLPKPPAYSGRISAIK